MKTISKIAIYIALVVVAFIAGWNTFNWYYNVDDLFDAYVYRGKVIQAYEENITKNQINSINEQHQKDKESHEE